MCYQVTLVEMSFFSVRSSYTTFIMA